MGQSDDRSRVSSSGVRRASRSAIGVALVFSAAVGSSIGVDGAAHAAAPMAVAGGPLDSLELLDVAGPLPDLGGNARGGFRLAVRNNGPDPQTSITVSLTPPGAGSLAFVAGRPVVDAPGWACSAPAADDTVQCTLPGLVAGATSPTITDASRLFSVWGEPSHVASWRISYTAQGIERIQTRPPGWRFEATTPANDDIVNSVLLTGTTGTLATTTWGSTIAPGGGPGEDGTGSVWYRTVATCPGTLSISTANTPGSIPFWATPQLEVFTETPGTGLVEQARSYAQFAATQSVHLPVLTGDVVHVALVSRVLGPTTTADGFYTYGDFGGRGDLDLSWSTDCLTASLTADRPPDHAGWYSAPVTMTASSPNAPVELSATGAQTQPATVGPSPRALSITVDGTSTVTAVPVSSDLRGDPTTAVVNLDQTAPTVQIDVPVADARYTSDAVPAAAFSCADSTSGSASCTGTVGSGAALDSSVGDHTLSVIATDNAGNTFTRTVAYHVTAGTNLTVTLSADRPPRTSGWYTAPVTLTATAPAPAGAVLLEATAPGGWKATGTSLPTGPLNQYLTLTQDRIYQVTATAFGPNPSGSPVSPSTSRTLTVRLDAHAPVIVVSTPLGRPTYTRDQAVRAAFSCDDALSGVASCTGSTANGAPLDTSTVGRHTVTLTSTDVAGNSTRTTQIYDVIPGDQLALTVTGQDGFTRSGTVSAGDIGATRSGNVLTGLLGLVTLSGPGTSDTVFISCASRRALFDCVVTLSDLSPGLPRRTFSAVGSVPIVDGGGGRFSFTVPGTNPRKPYTISIDLTDKS